MKKFKKLSVMLSVILCMSMFMGMGTVFADNKNISGRNVVLIEETHEISEVDLVEQFKMNTFDDILATKYYDLDGNAFYKLSSLQLIEAFSTLIYEDKNHVLDNMDCDTVSVAYANGSVTIETDKLEYTKERTISTYTRTASTSRIIIQLGRGTTWTMTTTYVENNQPMGVYIEDSVLGSAPYGNYSKLSEAGRENTQLPSGQSGMTDIWTISVNTLSGVEDVTLSTKSIMQ